MQGRDGHHERARFCRWSRAALSALAAWLPTTPGLGFEGVVVLPDGGTAAHAVVSVLGQSGSTLTGPDGRFTWEPSPRPPFQVLVILPGGIYTAPVLVEQLTVGGAPFVLRLRATLNEAVTVHAGTTPHTESSPASAATLLTSRDLEQRRPRTVTDALEAVPGVSRLGGGHTSVPAIRGLARGRTLILLDGARVSSERRAGPSATYLDPFFLEALEVSRGLGAVTYGSDALGGVIHARTRRPASGSPFEGQVQGTLGMGVPEQAAGLSLAKGFKTGGAIVQLRYRNFDDYQSPLGTVRSSSLEDRGARVGLHRDWGPGTLSLGWQGDRGRDVGKPDTSETTVTSYPYEDSDRFYLDYVGQPRAGLPGWSVAGFLGRYRLLTQRDRLAQTARPGTLSRSDASARDYGARATLSSTTRGLRLAGGLDFNGRFGLRTVGDVATYDLGGQRESITASTSIERASRHDAGVYVSLDATPLSHLTLSGGLRFDRVTTNNRGGFFGSRATAHNAVSGFGAFMAGPLGGLTLTAQAGSGFRDPTLSDRYFRGVTGRGFVTGLPELQAERSLQYDLALRRSGKVRAALYLYRYRIHDLIERFRGGDDFFFRNRGRVLLRGVELELQTEFPWELTVELGAQAAAGRDLETKEPLADVPAERLLLTLRKNWSAQGSVLLRAVLQARDEDAGATEVATPAHGTLDAAATWRLKGGLDARLSVRNIFDHVYPQSADEAAALAPGRSAALTLSARF